MCCYLSPELSRLIVVAVVVVDTVVAVGCSESVNLPDRLSVDTCMMDR